MPVVESDFKSPGEAVPETTANKIIDNYVDRSEVLISYMNMVAFNNKLSLNIK